MGAMGAAVLVLMAAAVVSVHAAENVPYWPTNKTSINVCTSEYTPMVYCEGRDPSGYSGYEIELFRKVQLILGWTDAMLNWSCLPFDEMMNHLKQDDGQCDIAVDGIQETSAYIAQDGLVFTRPTYRNGLKILVVNTQHTSGIWAFWDAFTWQLWLAAGLTAIAVAITVWSLDMFYKPRPDLMEVPTGEDDGPSAEERETHFQRYLWEAATRPMMTRDHIATSFAGNIVVAVFSFLALILFTLYLGNTAANLTTVQLDTGSIRSVKDLRGKAVGTWTAYNGTLKRYGITAKLYPWDTTADEDAMFAALSAGEIKALVLDGTLLDNKAATDCSFSVVGGAFELFDQATAFPANFSGAALLKAYDDAMVALQESGDIQTLVSTYVAPAVGLCSGLSTSRVSFSQVAGLWIVLAGCIGLGVLVLALQITHAKLVAPRLRASPGYVKACRQFETVVSKLPRAYVAAGAAAGSPVGAKLVA